MCGKIPKKDIILAILMLVFKRGMIFLSKNDIMFSKTIEELPDNFSFLLSVKNTDLKVALTKTGGVFKTANKNENSDLVLQFNNLCSAFLVFSGLMPQHEAFAQHRLSIKGSIGDALVITQAINRLQSIIFPDFISKRLIKEFKKSGIEEKSMFLKFYLYGLIV